MPTSDLLPIEEVLRRLGFEPNAWGNPARRWGDLEVFAAPWLGSWVISAMWVSKREAADVEVHVPTKVSCEVLTAILYRIWRERFRDSAPVPRELCPGRDYLARQAALKALIPPPPFILADRDFLRFCLSRIERDTNFYESTESVRFGYGLEQLVLRGDGYEYHVPARGKWLGSVTVAGNVLFRTLPRRFVTSGVLIEFDNQKLIIDGHRVPGTWDDSEMLPLSENSKPRK